MGIAPYGWDGGHSAPYGWETPWSSIGGDAHIALINNIDTKHENAYVDKYVIIPNHIHMIIALKNGAMWASPPTDGMAGAARLTHDHLAIATYFKGG